MKKYLALLALPIFFACSDDDTPSGSIKVISSAFMFSNETSEGNGKYNTSFSATVVNNSSTDVNGYVRFEIEGYGYLDSEIATVTNEAGHQNTFFGDIKNGKKFEENDLIKVEFIRQ